ncbi:hypothetical protein CXT20_18230 [Salmonella enterica]|nr:hypothetical protein [Salmonella enterica]
MGVQLLGCSPDVGFFIFALLPHSPCSMRPQTSTHFSFTIALKHWIRCITNMLRNRARETAARHN